MKKRHGLERKLPVIQLAELEAMPTGQLLARIKRLRWCEESQDHSDLTNDEVKSVGEEILFKDNATWRQAYQDVKSILAAREHLEKKP